ncbi:hypothetical protein HKX48_008636 [Thoreauomyces humboldtii]|nr:hypothetical protein HKX48_008636 [Thoreauomyces humboldtii]
MSKLIEYLGLDELGSNFPKEMFDPKGFPKDAYFEKIAHRQSAERPPLLQPAPNATPQLAAAVLKAQQRAIQFSSNLNKLAPKASFGASSSSSTGGKRTTKWDQPSEQHTKRRK